MAIVRSAHLWDSYAAIVCSTHLWNSYTALVCYMNDKSVEERVARLDCIWGLVACVPVVVRVVCPGGGSASRVGMAPFSSPGSSCACRSLLSCSGVCRSLCSRVVLPLGCRALYVAHPSTRHTLCGCEAHPPSRRTLCPWTSYGSSSPCHGWSSAVLLPPRGRMG